MQVRTPDGLHMQPILKTAVSESIYKPKCCAGISSVIALFCFIRESSFRRIIVVFPRQPRITCNLSVSDRWYKNTKRLRRRILIVNC